VQLVQERGLVVSQLFEDSVVRAGRLRKFRNDRGKVLPCVASERGTQEDKPNYQLWQVVELALGVCVQKSLIKSPVNDLPGAAAIASQSRIEMRGTYVLDNNSAKAVPYKDDRTIGVALAECVHTVDEIFAAGLQAKFRGVGVPP
jgi:hypothetical protein